MTPDEFRDVLERYDELRGTLVEHPDETWEWAEAVLELERLPTVVPDLPAHAAQWERDFWERRKAREDER